MTLSTLFDEGGVYFCYIFMLDILELIDQVEVLLQLHIVLNEVFFVIENVLVGRFRVLIDIQCSEGMSMDCLEELYLIQYLFIILRRYDLPHLASAFNSS